MMAYIPMIMGGVSMLSQQQGAAQGAAAARQAGIARVQQANFTAEQLVSQAGQERAAAQRAAAEERHKAELVQSRALAVAAASGGGVSDPTIVNLLGKTAGEGAYRANMALYEGEEKARALRMKARAAIYEGQLGMIGAESQASATETAGTGSLIRGASSLFSKYGGGLGGFGGGSGTAAASGGFSFGADTFPVFGGAAH